MSASCCCSTFGLSPISRRRPRPCREIGWALGGLGFGSGSISWVFYADLIRATATLTMDLVVGAAAGGAGLRGRAAADGLPLPIMCGVFLAYWFFGQYLPAPLQPSRL
jgi:TRAP-type uncharacterized transport system fused permease subunit